MLKSTQAAEKAAKDKEDTHKADAQRSKKDSEEAAQKAATDEAAAAQRVAELANKHAAAEQSKALAQLMTVNKSGCVPVFAVVYCSPCGAITGTSSY